MPIIGLGDTVASVEPVLRGVSLGGLNFDRATDDGAAYRLNELEAWDGASASTGSTTQKQRGPGGWASVNPQLTPLSLTLTGYITGPDLPSLNRALRAAKAAASLELTTLTVRDLGGETLSLAVRRQGEPLGQIITPQLAKFSLGLIAPDPRKMGAPIVVTTSLPSQTGGLTLPARWPVRWSAVTATGQVALVNPGNIVGPALVTAYGPLPDFTVTHTGASGTQVLTVALPMVAGEFVTVDMEAQTVLAQGQASRTTYVTSRGFSPFDPGPNTWAFTSTTPSPSATFTVAATPSWE